MEQTYFVYETAIGALTVCCTKEAVIAIRFAGQMPPEAQQERTALSDRVAQQIQEYLQGMRKNFELPLQMTGTDFQKMVWTELCKIPYGETRSYQQIAQQIHNPKACRAVGLANNRNPLPILIPCHRVLGADGSLTGYAGGLDCKQKLLELEKTFK
ncbi:MAG: methylated-DNA--[protein]-cysteine S-methyltransferase [Anaerotruncus sp.]|nr:methylated-DNA--[protein]-cysteine S-methyltransferase [Anaerotruncus sp.]